MANARAADAGKRPKFPLYHIFEKLSNKNRIVIFNKFFPENGDFLVILYKIVKNFTEFYRFVAFCYQIVTILSLNCHFFVIFCHFFGKFWKFVKILSICNRFVTICYHFVTFWLEASNLWRAHHHDNPIWAQFEGKSRDPYSPVRAHMRAIFFQKLKNFNFPSVLFYTDARLTFLKKFDIILKKSIFFRAITFFSRQN